jgi:DNA-binding CsgD family transcriptional regulator
MNPSEELGFNFRNVIDKFIKVGIDQQEAKQLVDGLLEQPWLQKLMVFNDQAIFITDMKTSRYIYVSPSVENIIGYKAEEFTNISSLAKILTPSELAFIPKGTEIAMTKIVSLNYSVEQLLKLRYSRNNWYRRKDGALRNMLQQSIGLAFNEQSIVLVELLVATDITDFNPSPHHFYTIAEQQDDGTSKVLFHGVLEQDHITPREQEVYALLTQGKTTEEIANQLKISTETVKTHRKNLLEKTGTENSVDLVRYGFAQGWI